MQTILTVIHNYCHKKNLYYYFNFFQKFYSTIYNIVITIFCTGLPFVLDSLLFGRENKSSNLLDRRVLSMKGCMGFIENLRTLFNWNATSIVA